MDNVYKTLSCLPLSQPRYSGIPLLREGSGNYRTQRAQVGHTQYTPVLNFKIALEEFQPGALVKTGKQPRVLRMTGKQEAGIPVLAHMVGQRGITRQAHRPTEQDASPTLSPGEGTDSRFKSFHPRSKHHNPLVSQSRRGPDAG